LQEYDEAIKKAKKDVIEYEIAAKEVYAKGEEGWTKISDGLTKVGETAIAAGTAISMVGGIISSLGLEGIGDTIT
jgi:hypothetical protein